MSRVPDLEYSALEAMIEYEHRLTANGCCSTRAAIQRYQAMQGVSAT